MLYKYICTNDTCSGNQGSGHQVVLSAELVMDENNIAMIYCPRCKQALRQMTCLCEDEKKS